MNFITGLGRLPRKLFTLSLFSVIVLQPVAASPGIPVAAGMAPTLAVGVQGGMSNGKGSLAPEVGLGFALAAAGGGGFFFGALTGSLGYDTLQDDTIFNLGVTGCSNDICLALSYLNVDGNSGIAARAGYVLEEPMLTQLYIQTGFAKEFNVYAGAQYFLFLE